MIAYESRWHLTGSAVFAHESAGCRLDYSIVCDATWRTVSARVTGWIGNRAIAAELVVDSARGWHLNEIRQSNVAGCEDIDLAFSPSTNLLPIRRLGLKRGEEASVRAAWLRFPDFTLEPLEQRYRRLGATTYQYETDGGAFAVVLRTDATGFVTLYPDLWEVEEPGPVP